MVSSRIICSLVLGLVASVHGGVIPWENNPNFPETLNDLASLTWQGELEAGKGPVNITGSSFEDIEKQAKAMNPSYTIFGKNQTDGGNQPQSLPPTEEVCGQPLPYANGRAIYDGVAYLRDIKGDCWMRGHSQISRVSCSYDAGIYVGNYNDFDIAVRCSYFGDVAASIARKCSRNNGWPGGEISGNLVDTNRWFEFVGREPNGC